MQPPATIATAGLAALPPERKAASLVAKLLREPAAWAMKRLLDLDGSLPAESWACWGGGAA
jgi:hypothetical protein